MNRKKILFYALLVVGLGFCIGGVFVPALFPVGSACILGAVAVAQNLSQQVQPQLQTDSLDNPDKGESQIDVHIPQCDESLEVDLHIGHHPSRRLPKTFQKPDTGSKIEGNHGPKADPDNSVQKHRP